MFQRLVSGLVGSANERVLKKLRNNLAAINNLEPAMQALGDDALREHYAALRAEHQQGKSLDNLLPRVFALVREAGQRALNMRHFNVQLLGGMALHFGNIAEMPTGEGKTLVATLAACLNALTGRGVHLVTVNDYLAQRDSDWMRPLYAMLGLEAGCIFSNQPRDERKQAYVADITYATNNELGFDFLRDNMVLRNADRVQSGHFFAIVDEVDSILIDEARTPLIISGAAQDSSDAYQAINAFTPRLTRQLQQGEAIPQPGDFVLDEKQHSIELTEAGHDKVEQLLFEHNLLEPGTDLYNVANLTLMHYVNCSLRAHHLFTRDIHYMVVQGQVVIVDEHTGRPMPGRRWSNGIHQAVEAKEQVRINPESQTLASITFQNYFRHYEKLAGMTGTADTEAYEFREIYDLNVVLIPPNQPSRRVDSEDKIYITKKEKLKAIVEEIDKHREAGQPILVGTPSIHASEEIAAELTQHKIPFELLNAKQPEREAHIISQAGVAGTVTIATNMAGRGTDIVLGGNVSARLEQSKDEAQRQQLSSDWQAAHDTVVAAGGLHIIGTERHESRRIDNQLRGRAGRQGDPGSTCFYLSLEDDLMRIFASDRIRGIIARLRLPEGEAINHRMVSNAIERAQRKVETRNFDIRKQLLEYDDVANEQREVLYHMRNQVLGLEDSDQLVSSFFRDCANQLAARYLSGPNEHWRSAELTQLLEKHYVTSFDVQAWLEQDTQRDQATLGEHLAELLLASHNTKREQLDMQSMHKLQRELTLQVIDMNWVNHLRQLDILRSGVHLRGYAQKNPKQEYKREAYELFQFLLERIREDTVKFLLRVTIRTQSEVETLEVERRRQTEAQLQRRSLQHADANVLANAGTPFAGQPGGQTSAGEQRGATGTIKRDQPKLGRNEPCYCGSGKKYKHCHGALQ